MDELVLPHNLVDAIRSESGARRRGWLARLPATVWELARRWALEVDRPFQPGGRTAWVAPVRRGARDDLVLKVAWRHSEAEHEADGLIAWAGNGSVRLHDVDAFDDETMAFLIERCVPGTALATAPEFEQDTVIARLLRRLWRGPVVGHRFRPLQQMCDLWADEFEQRTATRRPVDAGLVRDGIGLFRTLPATADRQVLLCTDLHAGNVLASRREPWLAIDPKPFVGDPTYDVLQHMLNCEARLVTDPHGLTRRIAALLDLDRDRLLLWLFARCVQQSSESPTHLDIARRIAPT